MHCWPYETYGLNVASRGVNLRPNDVHEAVGEMERAGVRMRKDRLVQVVQKGTDPGIDSYSGFFDNGHRRATGLGDWLKSKATL